MDSFQKILIGSFILLGLLTANFALAAFVEWPMVPCGLSEDDPDTNWDETDSCNLCHLWHLISNIINFISFNLAIPAATILFVAAGIIFLVAGGSEERVTLAKSIFTNTVIGLVIIFTSWLLIDTLLKSLAIGAFHGAWSIFPSCP